MIRFFTLSGKHWGDVLVSRATPSGDDFWGLLRPLAGTDWESLIPVIPVNVFDDAVHGHLTPLLNLIGRPPERLLQLAPAGICEKRGRCTLYTSDCVPGNQTPLCYLPPLQDPEVQEAARVVVQAWRKGYYVIVVEE